MRWFLLLSPIAIWLMGLGVSRPQSQQPQQQQQIRPGLTPPDGTDSEKSPEQDALVQQTREVNEPNMLRDYALPAATVAGILGLGAAIGGPGWDYVAKKMGTRHGDILIEIERLKSLIPRTTTEYWCMRWCIFDEMTQDYERLYGRIDLFEHAFQQCQEYKCHLEDPLYVYFPRRMDVSKKKRKPNDPPTVDVKPMEFVSEVAGATKDSLVNAFQKVHGPKQDSSLLSGSGGGRGKPIRISGPR